MKVLLLAMPDAVSALDGLVTIPNVGLCSIAGNLTDCDVRVLDPPLKSMRRMFVERFLSRSAAFNQTSWA